MWTPPGRGEEIPFHIGIATPEVDSVLALLGPMFGLTWVALRRPPVVHHGPNGPVMPSSRVVWSQQGELHVEVVQAEPGTVYVTDRGAFLHHVGYWTADLTESIARYVEHGWRIEASLVDDDGAPTAFAYLSRPGQVWVELVDVANRDALLGELAGPGTSI